MRGSRIALAASLAYAGSATAMLLVPPSTTTIADVDSTAAFLELAATQPREHKVQLDCPGCSVVVASSSDPPAADADTPSTKLADSHLDFTVAIDHSDPHGDRLLLNNHLVYPNTKPVAQILTAPVVVSANAEPSSSGSTGGAVVAEKEDEHILGYFLRVRNVGTDRVLDMSAVQVDVQVVEVGGVTVAGVPNLRIKLVQANSARRLVIHMVEKTEPLDVDGACGFLCQLHQMMRETLRSAKATAGKHCGGGSSSASGSSWWAAEHGRGRHGGGVQADSTTPHRHHGHHGHKSYDTKHKHSWLQLFKNIQVHILLPALAGILIGIALGVLASVIGMLVSTFVVYLWRTFVRRSSHSSRRSHRRGRSGSKSQRPGRQPAAAVDDEKSGLLMDEELADAPLPPYSDEA